MSGRIIFFLMIIIQSNAVHCQWKRDTINIPLVKVCNSNLLQIADSFDIQEKQCTYYTDTLFFIINIDQSPYDSISLIFRVESQNNPSIAFGLNPRAIFIFKGNYWIINTIITGEFFKQVGEVCNIVY